MNSTVLVHYGITGMKWGQRNGPPYPLKFTYGDGSLTEYGKKVIKEGSKERSWDKTNEVTKYTQLYGTKDSRIAKAGITKGKDYDTIKKDSFIGRVANSGELVTDRRKYAYLTDDDLFSYGEMWDMIGLDMTKPISTFDYKATKDLKVKHADDVVKDVVNKYGDVQIKDLYSSGLLERRAIKLNDYSYKNGQGSKEDRFVYETLTRGNNFVDKVVKSDKVDPLFEKYEKEGYDAIVDPLDQYIVDYPIVLLNPKNSVILTKEHEWDKGDFGY